MSTSSSSSVHFPSEAEPEHIVGRGFEIALSPTELRIVDEDASLPSPIVLRSAWGRAVRTPRSHWPYDFEPLIYAGTQMWADRTLPLSPLIAGLFPPACFGPGRGAYVALDEVPPEYDSLEFVFAESSWPAPITDEVYMAWVVLDSRLPAALDPFVVTATRVLEPLIAQLRTVIDSQVTTRLPALEELNHHVEALGAAVRDLQREPSRMKTALAATLTALSSVVLNIVANRLDPIVDRIDWPALHNEILETIRRLALPYL